MPRAKSTKTTTYMKGDPIFEAGKTAGWHAKSKHFMSLDGKFITRSRAIEQNATRSEDVFGGAVKVQFPTPISSQFEILEVNMSNLSDPSAPMQGLTNIMRAALEGAHGYEDRMKTRFEAAVTKDNQMRAVEGFDSDPAGKQPPNYMPMQQLTRMNLAEHFYMTDGDASSVIDVPVELLTRDIDVDCSDTGLRDDVEEFIKDNGLRAMCGQLWSVEREYGQAYPMEVWNGKDLEKIVPLPPKSVHIGYNWAYGLTADMVGQNEWTEALLSAVFPPAMFKVLMRHWNDSPIASPAQGALIPGDYLRPIFDKERSWMRYSMPMLSRGFRELVTRTIYEDSVRAIVEGMRYQLWVIKVGDADHPPLPQEITALKDMLGTTAGERTGMFVWRDSPLTVEVFTPKGLDELLGNDYWGALTKQFYRKMGMTSHVVSGENPGSLGSSSGRGSGGGNSDMDTQIFLERVRFQSYQVSDWLTYLAKKWAKMQTNTPVKALKKLEVRFSPIDIELESRIKNIFLPLYDSGTLSHHTLMQQAGRDSQTELEYKKSEKKFRDEGLLDPPLKFLQGTQSPDGSKSVTGQTKPKGSPTETEEHKNAVEDKQGFTAQ